MVMKREDYEQILNKLNDPSIEQSERSDLLQQLRTDYGSVTAQEEKYSQDLEKLQKDNSDLVLSNSKLFRQLGIVGDSNMENKEKEKNFSETIRIEDVEGDY